MKPLSTKVPNTLYNSVEEYAEEHDISRSAATRELLRDGLDKENRETRREIDVVVTTVFQVGVMVLALGTVLGLTEVIPWYSGVIIASMGAGIAVAGGGAYYFL